MPRTIALTYLAFGAIWIFCTDRLLARMDVGAALMLQIQTYKGWSYVLVSAFLLYLLLRRQQQRDRAGMAALLQSQLQSQEKVRRMNADLEQRVAERTLQLATANNELESFAYAVSHDLRAPLRSMSGFSQILRDSAPAGLDQQSLHYLQRIQEASERMSSLIDDLLGLSRINRSELARRPVSLTRIAEEAAAAIRERHPERDVRLQIAPEMNVDADARLLRIALENL
jgi:signal transduction histidine kinase